MTCSITGRQKAREKNLLKLLPTKDAVQQVFCDRIAASPYLMQRNLAHTYSIIRYIFVYIKVLHLQKLVVVGNLFLTAVSIKYLDKVIKIGE